MNIEQYSTDNLKIFHDKVNEEASTTIHKFVVGYFLLGILIALYNGSWLYGAAIGGTAFLAYLVVKNRFETAPFYRYFVSFLFWNYPLQFTLQLQGLNEVYFFYFISLTVLLFYENWKVMIVPTIYTLLTVSAVYYVQLNDINIVDISQAHQFNNQTFAIHIAIITFYAGICVLWSNIQRNQTKESGVSQLEMEEKLKHLEANVAFADSISGGDLNKEYPSDTTDVLGESLLNMRNSLKEAQEREEKEKFMNVGLANIGEILRDNVNDLQQLCDFVMANLVKYIGANQGGVFIVSEDNEEELELIASVAFERIGVP